MKRDGPVLTAFELDQRETSRSTSEWSPTAVALCYLEDGLGGPDPTFALRLGQHLSRLWPNSTVGEEVLSGQNTDGRVYQVVVPRQDIDVAFDAMRV